MLAYHTLLFFYSIVIITCLSRLNVFLVPDFVKEISSQNFTLVQCDLNTFLSLMTQQLLVQKKNNS